MSKPEHNDATPAEPINPHSPVEDQADLTTAGEATIGSVLDDVDLQARITELEAEVKLEKARAANATYEVAKVKERLEREADTAKKFALEKFAKELLDVVDNLERALGAAANDDDPMVEGVKLTLKSLLSVLEKHGVVAVATDAGFNADLHQAVGIDPNAKAGEIGTVLQKGYTLADRLLRPAMVMVGQ